MKKKLLVMVLFFGLSVPSGQASVEVDAWIDRLGEALTVQSQEGYFRSDLRLLLDLETYYVDGRAPGLIFSDDSFFAPRLSLFLDTQVGRHWFSLLQVRFDRGFDPGVKKQDARLDEYFIRYTPFETPWVHLQVGKFATVVGNWVRRHDSWTNPFINAPLPYENVTLVNDQTAPADPAEFLRNRTSFDNKFKWLPILWGPAYATGLSVFGAAGDFDYAVEVKNNTISSRPAFWKASKVTWREPTWSARLGWRPHAAWDLGTSFSIGPYLFPKVTPTLPPGKEWNDFKQITLGYDVQYAYRKWQFWFEAFLSRFQVPAVGNADSLSYYLEAKRKITPQLYLSARWNQQFFDKVADGTGGSKTWDRNIFRVDAALGYRFTRHVQMKAQYSFNHQKGDIQQGKNLAAFQVTVKV